MLRFAGSSSIVHIPSLFRQLGNEKVVLHKLSPKTILHYDYSTTKENNSNNCDGSFFQELEKKMPTEVDKNHYSKCNNDDSQIEESNPNIPRKNSSEFSDSHDVQNSSTSKCEKGYYVVFLQEKSSALKKVCIPCKNKVFYLNAKNCTECNQTLTIQCIKCGKLFSNHKSTNNHLEICSPLSKFCCANNCGYETTMRRGIQFHIKTESEFLINNDLGCAKMMIVCKVCKRSFAGRKSFVEHVRHCGGFYTTKYKSYPEKYYNLKNNPDLMSKIKEHCLQCGHEQDFDCKTKRVYCSKCKNLLKWKCIPCDKLYGTINNTFLHLKKSHIEDRTMKCHNCNKEFRNFLKLDIHIRYCRSKTYKCTYTAISRIDKHIN